MQAAEDRKNEAALLKEEKLQKKEENKQAESEKNDIVSAALRMRRARDALDSERSRNDKKDKLKNM